MDSRISGCSNKLGAVQDFDIYIFFKSAWNFDCIQYNKIIIMNKDYKCIIFDLSWYVNFQLTNFNKIIIMTKDYVLKRQFSLGSLDTASTHKCVLWANEINKDVMTHNF